MVISRTFGAARRSGAGRLQPAANASDAVATTAQVARCRRVNAFRIRPYLHTPWPYPGSSAAGSSSFLSALVVGFAEAGSGRRPAGQNVWVGFTRVGGTCRAAFMVLAPRLPWKKKKAITCRG